MEDNLFDSLLDLEDQYYKEGHDLGTKDGTQAGLVEGRLFGIEKGFEKYIAMAKLHGRSILWAGRLSPPPIPQLKGINSADTSIVHAHRYSHTDELPLSEASSSSIASTLPPLQHSARIERHIRTMYALTEPGSISTENNEDSVSDFDDRLKRADGKTKIIEHSLGENLVHLTGTISDGIFAIGTGSSHKGKSRANHRVEADGTIEDVINA